ncbi:MAG TPA: radical SAM protein [Lachnospiraceae bacterium]|uniref:SPL family radical SAM protein n=1 Tax=Anaerosporobacter sp. TaxID=1872529 RepID=UPI000EDEC36A|nr:radical SAM protein [Anaerosporobacter sp.]HAB60938.1 radical SAM protein [Lachnospiraceae bacterium]
MHYKEVKAILSPSNGMNLYRGCSHGCIYCDARSTCYNMQHDFEDIEVKANAVELLEKTLANKRNKGMIGTGAMSDPYLHIEKELHHTRRCLELIDRYEYGLAIQTKSDLILRDLDLLKSINEKTKCVVQMTMTTYDDELCKIIEPNVCVTSKRAEVLNVMRDNGIPTIVWMTPILPFINDTEENIRGLIKFCVEAKVYGILLWDMGVTLREGDREYFYKKLDEHFPGLKRRYINTYGNQYMITSPNNDKLMKIVREECQKHGIVCGSDVLFSYMKQFETKVNIEQMSLFDFL